MRVQKFIPFNLAPRSCVGRESFPSHFLYSIYTASGEHSVDGLTEEFGMNLATYVLSRMVQAFEDIESRDERDWVEDVHMACTSFNGAKVVMRVN